jgi:hypothetical protein
MVRMDEGGRKEEEMREKDGMSLGFSQMDAPVTALGMEDTRYLYLCRGAGRLSLFDLRTW